MEDKLEPTKTIVEDLIKAVAKAEKYEAAMKTIYNNVKNQCVDKMLKHCILSTIESVMPEIRDSNVFFLQ